MIVQRNLMAKSSSGYELYHNSFANAMSHAYTMAKKIHRVDIDRNEIDDKVATGLGNHLWVKQTSTDSRVKVELCKSKFTIVEIR